VQMKKIIVALTSIYLACLIAIALGFYFFNDSDSMLFIMHADGSNACIVIDSQSRNIQKQSFEISLVYYVPKNGSQVNSFFYNLNGQSNVTLSYFSRPTTSFSFPYVAYSIFKSINNLPNDDYRLEVYASFVNGTITSIYRQEFKVNTDFVPPKLIVLSPQNQTIYNSNNVPFVYNINSDVRWAYYALDKSGRPEIDEWIRFDGNTTLSGLVQGSHKLIISVQSESNMDAEQPICEQTICFEVRFGV
jgi:hypothetical protein